MEGTHAPPADRILRYLKIRAKLDRPWAVNNVNQTITPRIPDWIMKKAGADGAVRFEHR